MNGDIVSALSLVCVVAASMLLIWGNNWRWLLAAITLQYLGVFGLVFQNWSLSLALVKGTAGLAAGGVLVSAFASEKEEVPQADTISRVFKSLVLLFIWVVIYFIHPELEVWLPVEETILLGAMALVGSGLVQLGLTIVLNRTALGLLTLLAGFEVLYSALVSSVLLAGLLAGVNLMISLTGLYLGAKQRAEFD